MFDQTGVYYRESDAYETISKLAGSDIYVSVIADIDSAFTLGYVYDLVNGTGGEIIAVSEIAEITPVSANVRTMSVQTYAANTSTGAGEAVKTIINGIKNAVTEKIYERTYNVIKATGYQKVVLDSRLCNDRIANTDKDGLPDWDEVDFNEYFIDKKLFKFNTVPYTGYKYIVQLPTLQDFIDYKSDLPYVQNGLQNFYESAEYHNRGYELLRTELLPITSDPTSEDSDGDGLLDGMSRYVKDGQEVSASTDSKKVVPKDPAPLKYNGPPGANSIWQRQVYMQKTGENTAFDYSNDYYESDDLYFKLNFWWIIPYVDNNLLEYFLSSVSEIGSKVLDFRYDNKHIALHADTTQWQAIGGYNDFYDWIFNAFTSMDKLKLDFKSGEKDYVVWVWKGNYLNLGAGSEIGFYTKNNIVEKWTGLEQWMVTNEFPMTLSLYKRINENAFSNYYNWQPEIEQWWITGFSPNIYDYSIKAEELVMVASVNFSGSTWEKTLYSDLKDTYKLTDDGEYLIFDDEDNILWIIF